MNVLQNIKINASEKIIFDYLNDISNRKEYIPALDKIILLDPLPLKIGSRYIEVSRIAGQKMETTYQITDFIPDKQISAKTIKSFFPINVDLTIREQGLACILTINLNFQLSGIYKLASVIIKEIVKQQAKQILEKLKFNIEENY
jgi:carbon monoxide dehydrogenase subunit G